jgi:hypothetical protein
VDQRHGQQGVAGRCRAAGFPREALDRPLSDRTLAESLELGERLVREQTGGPFWAQPPDPAVLLAGCVLVLAAQDRTLGARMLQAAMERGDAAR